MRKIPLITLCASLAGCGSVVGELDRIQKKIDTTTNPPPVICETLTIAYPQNNRELFFEGWTHSFTPVLSATPTSCATTPALPAGLSIGATTCTISGTPTIPSAKTDYLVTALAGQRQGKITITLTVIAASASRVYGQPDFFSGSINAASSDSLANPLGLAVTAAGVFIADTAFHRALFFSGNDTIASQVYGQPDFLTETFPPSPNAASLKLPRGIAIDANGKIWIADRANHRVVRYSQGQSLADGLIGQAAYSSGTSGGCNSQALNAPDAVATDASGIYVADTLNNRVLYFPTLNPGTSLPSATRVYGQASFTSCTANAGGVDASTLSAPTSVTVSATGVYISDRINNRVLFFPGTSTTPTRVYGQPDFQSSAGATTQNGLNLPRGIAATEFGVFIADAGNNRVLFFRGDATVASVVFGQNGSFLSNGGNLGGIAANYLSTPSAVSFRDGLYVVDLSNNRLLFF